LLVETNSFSATFASLQRLSGTPQRYLTSTSIEALRVSAYGSERTTLKHLSAKYGETAAFAAVQRDEYRLAIKNAVLRAWKRRRRITSEVVEPLSCYLEVGPYEIRGLLELQPVRCNAPDGCALSAKLRQSLDELKKMKQAVDAQVQKPENIHRARALKEIIRKPRSPVSEEKCRHLGDAMIALLAPTDAVILTTNKRDLAPLANALNKRVEKP
jgi:hypothetical protein